MNTQKLHLEFKAKKANVAREKQELEKALSNRATLFVKSSNLEQNIKAAKEKLSLSTHGSTQKNWDSEESLQKIDSIGALAEMKEGVDKLIAEMNDFIDNPVHGKRRQCKAAATNLEEWKRGVIREIFDNELQSFLYNFERFFTIFQCAHLDTSTGETVYSIDNFYNCILQNSAGVFRNADALSDNQGSLYEEFFGDRCGK